MKPKPEPEVTRWRLVSRHPLFELVFKDGKYLGQPITELIKLAKPGMVLR